MEKAYQINYLVGRCTNSPFYITIVDGNVSFQRTVKISSQALACK